MVKLARAKSGAAYAEAIKHIPGGVNSPVRAYQAVGGSPLFIESGRGSKIRDIDGNELIDYVCSWGPLILGHAHPAVVSAVEAALSRGSSFGAPTQGEVRLARLIKEAFPSIEKVRLVNSGTEAAMSAIRLARGHTGRDGVIKFSGCYHGHVDGLLVAAGSGLATFGTPTSPGIPDAYARKTLVLPFNDLDAVAATCEAKGRDIACLIVEPIMGNMGVVPAKPGFLDGLREITRKHDIVFILDEVITGFRVAFGGAQERFGVQADMTLLGKIIGGGLPVGAYGGRAEIMDSIKPDGDVYQAGTLSGNPLAVSAGIAALGQLRDRSAYKQLEARSAKLAAGLEDAAKAAGVPTFHTRVGSMLSMFFTDREVFDGDSASQCDTERFGRYFWGMLDEGVYLAPSQFEAGFVSTAHTQADIDATIAAARRALKGI